MPPALPALSVSVTGTDFQVVTRYESTFASVCTLLNVQFCQFSTRTGGKGGQGILWGLWFLLFLNFLL